MKNIIQLNSTMNKTAQPVLSNIYFKETNADTVKQSEKGTCSCPLPCKEGECCYNCLSSRPLKWLCSLFFAF